MLGIDASHQKRGGGVNRAPTKATAKRGRAVPQKHPGRKKRAALQKNWRIGRSTPTDASAPRTRAQARAKWRRMIGPRPSRPVPSRRSEDGSGVAPTSKVEKPRSPPQGPPDGPQRAVLEPKMLTSNDWSPSGSEIVPEMLMLPKSMTRVSPKEPVNSAKTSGPLPLANPDVNASPNKESDTLEIARDEASKSNEPSPTELIITGLAFARCMAAKNKSRINAPVATAARTSIFFVGRSLDELNMRRAGLADAVSLTTASYGLDSRTMLIVILELPRGTLPCGKSANELPNSCVLF